MRKIFKIGNYIERLDGAGVVISSYREWNTDPQAFKCYAIDINFGSSHEIDTIWTNGQSVISLTFAVFIVKENSDIYIIPFRTVAPTDLNLYIPNNHYEINATDVDEYFATLTELFL